MKNLAFSALLLLSFTATASVDPAALTAARDMTKAMQDDEFCANLGASAYSLEGTQEDSPQRLTDRALNLLHLERARKWSNSQKDACTQRLMAGYKAALCAAEECD
ncbi:MAG: hypothetical protein ACRDDI_13395 [Aeromonas veronii]